MNREIKFRGKRIDNGEWKFGSLKKQASRLDAETRVVKSWIYWILDIYGMQDEVLSKTVCQYTGLKDKSGVEIYGGDILKVWFRTKVAYESVPVIWNDRFASYELKATGNELSYYVIHSFDNPFEVIGNIHETQKT